MSDGRKPATYDLVIIKLEDGWTGPAWWTGNKWEIVEKMGKGDVVEWMRSYGRTEVKDNGERLCR